MEHTKKRSWNALDIIIVLLAVLALAAFAMRGYILRLFEAENDRIVTYAFTVEGVEEITAASLRVGAQLYDEDGMVLGELLLCQSAAATDRLYLADGRQIAVQNGLLDLTCSVTAAGYEADGFVYLDGGILLVPGQTMTVSTVDALFTVRVTMVSIADAR